MSLQLPDDPDQYFIDQILLPDWNPAEVHGFDVQASPDTEAFIPVATSLDAVGASYPSLVVSYSNETAGGDSTYQYMTQNGPGQVRNGSLVATARVQDSDDGYTGDSSTYSAVEADTLASDVIDHVEDICARNATAPGTEFQHVGSQSGSDAPDDRDASPIVRLATCTISYSWRRER